MPDGFLKHVPERLHAWCGYRAYIRSMSDATEGEQRQRAPLPDCDRLILDFEREWAARNGDKDEAIRSQLGFSTARYYQMLSAVLASPAALAYDPMLVKRLQRLRDERVGARAARQLGRLE